MLATLLLPVLLTGGAPPPSGAIPLQAPRVEYRTNIASATRSPWINSNGWRMLRTNGATFAYDVAGATAALAAAEAFTYGAQAYISTDEPGSAASGTMIEFLKSVPTSVFPPAADFQVVDDDSEATGELLNLLTRMNLLYKIGKSRDSTFRLNVELGTKEYPAEEARNPGALAHKIRAQIGDGERSLRIYGSEVVIGRLMYGPRQARVFLLNYSLHPILGLRVRVRGFFSPGQSMISGAPGATLTDWEHDKSATEFTVPELNVAAVIDLSRN